MITNNHCHCEQNWEKSLTWKPPVSAENGIFNKKLSSKTDIRFGISTPKLVGTQIFMPQEPQTQKLWPFSSAIEITI
jgi:hypothetical protein